MRVNLRPALLDVLLASVLTALTFFTLISHTDGRAGPFVHVLAALTAAPLVLRQLAPVVTTLVIAGALAAYSLLGYGDHPNAGIGVLIALFTVATLRSRPVTAALFVLTVTVMTVSFLTTTSPASWSEIAQSVLEAAGACVLGEGTKRWGRRTERLAERAVRAVAEERVRIARELHDIVAHHMSVISLQAGLAQYVLDTDLATARKAITTVGDTSREALAEMRRLLDVLRVDHTEDDDFAPQPGLAVLGELVDRTRGAGLPVDVVVSGRARQLPPGPDLCAYRVAQESLTNVLKHAGPASARIELDYGENTLTLKVSDDGATTRPRPATATSHGIRGMRERAELYGGVLTAGPAEGAGSRWSCGCRWVGTGCRWVGNCDGARACGR
ncbi:sensor histidine kinase [Umezawaea sp. Da 62-37]|uniref:sensor histidine kinase n=1 Tax=Umezawaea sp. Da 62-37 TaxID=3075927 RepID=UPI0028F746A2|nr:sensor histidine kinase [Umezawaea sp. Da 62-37]WNV88910.1 sensor histidine kinase [Umezawaea sp. Da 62-37]